MWFLYKLVIFYVNASSTIEGPNSNLMPHTQQQIFLRYGGMLMPCLRLEVVPKMDCADIKKPMMRKITFY